jgi:hypothetical protein
LEGWIAGMKNSEEVTIYSGVARFMKKTAGLFIITALLLLASIAIPAHAWWDQGHEIVASIAWEKMDPSTQDKLRALGFDETRFMNAACLADDIKNETNAATHYVNWVYDNSGKTQKTMLTGDLLTAIPALVQIIDNNSRDIVSIKFLTHLIGDLHCPMHNIAYMQNGESDLGGNKFYITLPSGDRVKLHAYWDGLPSEIALTHCKNAGVPYEVKKCWNRETYVNYLAKTGDTYSDEKFENNLYDRRFCQYNGLISTGRKLVEKANISKENVNPANIASLVNKWSYNESYQLACRAYHQDMDINKPFMNSGDVISPEYAKQANKEARLRLVLAGYRLASILDAIFSN